ncbi:MAG: right-handed parallel beta-helix repeat-containing protein [Spirochaetes bacterium]|nr:right-handed parallel beta-helix repeat-containing protein [Spirochaetota bacterium]
MRVAVLLAAAAVMLTGGCSGCVWSGQNELRFYALLDSLLSTLSNRPLASTCSANVPAEINNCDAATWYIDFDGGSDDNTGTSAAAAWKHCPGDPNATAVAAGTVLQPGDMTVFRPGVRYRGSITLQSSGTADEPIVFKGNCADWGGGRAVLEGSEPLTGWQACTSADACGGNPYWANIYLASIPSAYQVTPYTANLHEDDEFLWVAQEPDQPDPFFWDEVDYFYLLGEDVMTATSLIDADVFNQTDADYWDGSSVALWINPNIVVVREILSFDPDVHRITYADVGGGGVYTGRETRYSIINSIHALDQAGEYYINPEANPDGSHTAYLWPRNAGSLAAGISVSIRKVGIDIADESNIIIEGFRVLKYSGDGLTDGVGIGSTSLAYRERSGITIRNNEITHNRHGTTTGYGGVYLSNCTGCLVENNDIAENARHSGIFLGGGSCSVVRGNTVRRAGSTSICFFGMTLSQIVENSVIESNGSHANGITLYLSCNTILVARNRVIDSNSPITFQDSGNLFFIRNLVDATGRDSNVNEWGPAHTGGSFGAISFLNNTLVRNSRDAALNIGGYHGNPYLSFNNIIDGGGGSDDIRRDYNIYTGLGWSQDPYYGWYLEDHESVVTDMDALFVDPDNADPELCDFAPAAGSPAIDAGRDITPYLPRSSFPFFDFWIDINGGAVLPGTADIGAYERP